MKILTLSGHVDREVIRLDEPYQLPPDAKVLITVLSKQSSDGMDQEWFDFSLAGLSRA